MVRKTLMLAKLVWSCREFRKLSEVILCVLLAWLAVPRHSWPP